MGAYPSAAGGTIGSLLRAIQEEKQQGPLATPPQTEAGSPIRNLVQAPLMQAESPESSRVISVRPEAAPVQQGVVQSVVPPVPAVVPAASVVAPTAPSGSPASSPQFSLPSAQPNFSSPASPVSAVRQPSPISATSSVDSSGARLPSLATVIKPTLPSPTPTPSKSQSSPTQGRSVFGDLLTIGTRLAPLLRIGPALLNDLLVAPKKVLEQEINRFNPFRSSQQA